MMGKKEWLTILNSLTFHIKNITEKNCSKGLKALLPDCRRKDGIFRCGCCPVFWGHNLGVNRLDVSQELPEIGQYL